MGKKKKQEEKAPSASPFTTLIVALISSILFFLLGVMVGKEYAIREGATPVAERTATSQPVESPPLTGETPKTKGKGPGKVNITFYDQLMKSGDQELKQEIAESQKNSEPSHAKRESQKKRHEKPNPQNKEKPLPKPKAEASASTGNYALQVAAFRNRENALKMVRILEREGFHAHILKGTYPSQGKTFYRVWVGYYRNLTDASRARHALLQQKATRITRVIIVKR